MGDIPDDDENPRYIWWSPHGEIACILALFSVVALAVNLITGLMPILACCAGLFSITGMALGAMDIGFRPRSRKLPVIGIAVNCIILIVMCVLDSKGFFYTAM